MFNQQQKSTRSKPDLMRYAGLGMQLFVGLGLAVFAGYKADKWLAFGFPILVLALPVIVLFLMIYKLIKETSKKTNDEK